MPQRNAFGRGAPTALAPLATSIHALTEQMLRTVDDHSAFDEDIAWAVEHLAEIRARLARHERSVALALGRPDDPADGRRYYVSGVLVGRHHPMYMPIELQTDEGVTRGSVNLDIVWEGPPGYVHGGYVAHLFDCIMGQHNLNVGIPGMTGTLTIRYRAPTPLHTDLGFEVRTARQDGRKIVTTARVEAASQLVAEAEGLFIVPENFSFAR